MKSFGFLLAIFTLASSHTAFAADSKPFPLDYNLSGQETKALQSIDPQTADIVVTTYKDLDEDGVDDRLDHCPNTILNAEVDARGCELDSDADKVVNRLDQCPDTAPGAKVNRFGCEPDEDRDGVVDSKDQCPGTPEGTPVDEVGCTIIMDADRDGVLDADDLCPNTAEGVVVNEHGCEPKAIVLTNIVFDSWEHAIRDDQAAILKSDAGALNKLEEGEALLITGHTDWQGSQGLNERLSWRRANSTKEFLVKEFQIAEDRILIDGKGETQPIADNNTAEGRQQNRRIEMKIIKIDEIPTEAQTFLPEQMLKR
ncbi:OmpA family protein [Thiomicrorhabdus sediminis]|uniref:OmpA family protein n=1 Tax=Thiomicrorhabdus sediminis TaxID=2580412 RepID=A0A4P9K3D1_9GAMM|nr:OmpA family protein [Thiomicrorhabdus sediminis]QCU89335.1 OmpA family protein [Thiomicrorhabdus sediminis]